MKIITYGSKTSPTFIDRIIRGDKNGPIALVSINGKMINALEKEQEMDLD